MDNIITFNKNKEVAKKFHLEVQFVDYTSEKVVCDLFGASIDIENYIVFLEGKDDDMQPIALFNSDKIKAIRVESVTAEEEENDKQG